MQTGASRRLFLPYPFFLDPIGDYARLVNFFIYAESRSFS